MPAFPLRFNANQPVRSMLFTLYFAQKLSMVLADPMDENSPSAPQ